MTSLDAVTGWVGAYRRAWESNDPGDIGGLFTEDAAYFTEPWAKPWVGRERIVAEWLERRDEPGAAEFDWHPLNVTEDLSIIEARTVYKDPPKIYRNIWLLRLDANGQARQFTEWWMEEPAAETS